MLRERASVAVATPSLSLLTDGAIWAEFPESSQRYVSVDVIPCGRPTDDHRIYPVDLLRKLILQQGRMHGHGTLGDPTETTAVVEPERASHVWSDLRITKHMLTCDIRVLDTPMGRLLQELAPRSLCFRIAGFGDGRYDHKGNFLLTEFQICSINVMPKLKPKWKTTNWLS